MFIELTGLPPTDPVYRILVSTLRRQVNALVPLQDPKSGLWHTILDDTTSYVETSGSSGFVGGILMAIRLVRRSITPYREQVSTLRPQGLLEPQTYSDVALSGLKGCLAQVLPSGQVGNVSKGTPAGDDKDFYRGIPRMGMVYGNSLLIVALVQWMRLNQVQPARIDPPVSE
jgi:unsaturated rhamnogalacturonyl hydrolase